MKRTSLYVLGLCLALTVISCNKNKDSNQAVNNGDIVAKVGDTSISKTEFDGYVAKAMKRFYALGKNAHPGMENRIKANILRRLTDNLMFEQKAKQLGIKIQDSEIDSRFNEQKARFGEEKSFKEYLARTNNTEEELRKDVRFSILKEKVMEKMVGKVEATEQEMKEYYETNKNRYVEPAEVHARHILVRVNKDKFVNQELVKNASPEDRKRLDDEAMSAAKNAALAKIKDIQQKLQAPGADFGQIAMEYSEGPTAPKGGDLGFFNKRRMEESFSKAAFALKDGEISDVVETVYGYHLIQTLEHKEEVQKSYEEVKEGIRNSIENRRKGDNRRDVVSKLKEEFKPEILIKVDENSSVNNVNMQDFKDGMDKNGRIRHHRGPRDLSKNKNQKSL